MLEAFKVLILGIVIIFMSGDIITFFSGIASDKEEKYYALVFLTGYAVNTTIFKIIVYMDIPLKNIARPYAAILFLGYILFWVKKRKTLFVRKSFIGINLVNIFVLLSAAWSYILYGANEYKGYGWWDIHYYAVQAEAVKSTPFHQWPVLAQSSPNMLAVTTYLQGAHRISLGTFSGLIAAIAGVDGASIIGFTDAFAMLMIFCGVIYYLGDKKIAYWKKILIALTATFIPGVVMTNLECFVPMLLFIGILVFVSKLLEDILLQKSVRGCILGGIIYASACTTLLDGIYVLVPILIIDILVMLLKSNISLKQGIVKGGIVLGSTVLWNIPYLQYIMEELQTNQARQGLNSIYYFAYSPGLFRWIFFGSTMEDYVSDKFVLVLTLIAVIMFILGVVGIVNEIIKKMDVFFINGMAVICASLMFFSMSDEMQYAFYKVLSLTIPILILGIWECINDITICIDKYVIVNARISKSIKKITVCGTTMFLLFCVACSGLRMAAIFPGFEKYADRLVGMYTVYSKEAKQLYTEIENSDDQNILMVCNDFYAELNMRWAYYYGRNKNMYALSEGQLSQSLNGRDSEGWEFLNVPNDVKIMYAYPNHDTVYPEQYRDTVAMTCAFRNGQYARIYDPWEGSEEACKQYTLSIFSKEKLDGEIHIQMENADANNGVITVDGVEYSYINGEELVIPIKLEQGTKRLYINSETDVKILNYSLNIE